MHASLIVVTVNLRVVKTDKMASRSQVLIHAHNLDMYCNKHVQDITIFTLLIAHSQLGKFCHMT